jgi:putative oxidoreductase
VVAEWDGAGSAMPKLSESGALAVLRIATGVLVFPHGIRKLIQGPVAAVGRQMLAHGFPESFAYVVTAGELAGLFLALGLYSRIAAAAVAATMWGIVIWVQLGLWSHVGTGAGVSLEYPLLVAVIATLLTALPPTRWSLDRRH